MEQLLVRGLAAENDDRAAALIATLALLPKDVTMIIAAYATRPPEILEAILDDHNFGYERDNIAFSNAYNGEARPYYQVLIELRTNTACVAISSDPLDFLALLLDEGSAIHPRLVEHVMAKSTCTSSADAIEVVTDAIAGMRANAYAVATLAAASIR